MSSASSVQRNLDRFYKSMDKSDFQSEKLPKVLLHRKEPS